MRSLLSRQSEEQRQLSLSFNIHGQSHLRPARMGLGEGEVSNTEEMGSQQEGAGSVEGEQSYEPSRTLHCFGGPCRQTVTEDCQTSMPPEIFLFTDSQESLDSFAISGAISCAVPQYEPQTFSECSRVSGGTQNCTDWQEATT